MARSRRKWVSCRELFVTGERADRGEHMERRGLLLGLLSLSGLAMWQARQRLNRVDFDLQPHGTVPGFVQLVPDVDSRISLGAGANPALIGLAPPGPALDPALVAEVAADPVTALFGTVTAPEVPVAYFTDTRCSICPRVEAQLEALGTNHPGLRPVTHELPLLGPSSDLAARALIAAGPDLAPELRVRLRRITAQALGPDTIANALRALGANPAAILAAMDSAPVLTQLDRSKALAQLFGFPGTPALVMGRVAILGAHSTATLEAILASQRG